MKNQNAPDISNQSYAPVKSNFSHSYTKEEVSIFFTKLACSNAPEEQIFSWEGLDDNTPIYFAFTVSFPFAFFKESKTKNLHEMIENYVKNTTPKTFAESERAEEEFHEYRESNCPEDVIDIYANKAPNAKEQDVEEKIKISDYKKSLNFISNPKVLEIYKSNRENDTDVDFTNKCYSAMSQALSLTGDSFSFFAKVEHDALFEIYRNIFATNGGFVQLPTDLKEVIFGKAMD